MKGTKNKKLRRRIIRWKIFDGGKINKQKTVYLLVIYLWVIFRLKRKKEVRKKEQTKEIKRT